MRHTLRRNIITVSVALFATVAVLAAVWIPKRTQTAEATAQAVAESGMNVGAISGDGNTNCNTYFSKLFIDGINAAKERLGIEDGYTYRFPFFPGGHSCAYIGGTFRTATQGVSITYAKQVLDFMFGSSK